jgi:hypothetical protein
MCCFAEPLKKDLTEPSPQGLQPHLFAQLVRFPGKNRKIAFLPAQSCKLTKCPSNLRGCNFTKQHFEVFDILLG